MNEDNFERLLNDFSTNIHALQQQNTRAKLAACSLGAFFLGLWLGYGLGLVKAVL